MTLNGRVDTVRVTSKTDGIRTFKNVRLILTLTRNSSILTIVIAPDEEIELNLNRCLYLEDSSQPGEIECIQDDDGEQKIILMDRNQRCKELLDHMRDYLTGQKRPRPPSPSPSSSSSRSNSASPPPGPRPSSPRRDPVVKNNKQVNDLIAALNGGNVDEASALARDLARAKQPVRFALDINDESGNAPQRLPPEPAEKPLKLKLSIETFSIPSNDNQEYEVAIMPSATIKDLKQIVHDKATISPDHQCWYVNRDLLPDDYKFDGTKAPRVNENAMLILYITKPQNG